MRAKYVTKKEEILKGKSYSQRVMPDLSYFEKSTIEKSAEETTEMLKRIAAIGYTHNKEFVGQFQSKEFDFVGTQKEKAQRNDERGTSETLYKT